MFRELSLTCQVCGKRFASALQMDPLTFEAIRMNNHVECCRICGRAARYSKRDYFFTEETDPAQALAIPRIPRL